MAVSVSRPASPYQRRRRQHTAAPTPGVAVAVGAFASRAAAGSLKPLAQRPQPKPRRRRSATDPHQLLQTKRLPRQTKPRRRRLQALPRARKQQLTPPTRVTRSRRTQSADQRSLPMCQLRWLCQTPTGRAAPPAAAPACRQSTPRAAAKPHEVRTPWRQSQLCASGHVPRFRDAGHRRRVSVPSDAGPLLRTRRRIVSPPFDESRPGHVAKPLTQPSMPAEQTARAFESWSIASDRRSGLLLHDAKPPGATP